MKTVAILSTAAILIASAAVAQPAPSPGGPRLGPDAGAPPPPRAAHFRLERGETVLDVKCAAEEPMKACADLTLQMLDRLATIPASPGGSLPDPVKPDAPKPETR